MKKLKKITNSQKPTYFTN